MFHADQKFRPIQINQHIEVKHRCCLKNEDSRGLQGNQSGRKSSVFLSINLRHQSIWIGNNSRFPETIFLVVLGKASYQMLRRWDEIDTNHVVVSVDLRSDSFASLDDWEWNFGQPFNSFCLWNQFVKFACLLVSDHLNHIQGYNTEYRHFLFGYKVVVVIQFWFVGWPVFKKSGSVLGVTISKIWTFIKFKGNWLH